MTGYRNAPTYVRQLATDPHFSYNEGFIGSLHCMMMLHDLSKHPGCWRPGPIYTRDEIRGEIVFEGPDASRVPELASELVSFLNSDEGGPAILRGACKRWRWRGKAFSMRSSAASKSTWGATRRDTTASWPRWDRAPGRPATTRARGSGSA